MSAHNEGTTYFPIAFASACYCVVCGLKETSYLSTFAPVFISVKSITTSTFSNSTTSTTIGGFRVWVSVGK